MNINTIEDNTYSYFIAMCECREIEHVEEYIMEDWEHEFCDACENKLKVYQVDESDKKIKKNLIIEYTLFNYSANCDCGYTNLECDKINENWANCECEVCNTKLMIYDKNNNIMFDLNIIDKLNIEDLNNKMDNNNKNDIKLKNNNKITYNNINGILINNSDSNSDNVETYIKKYLNNNNQKAEVFMGSSDSNNEYNELIEYSRKRQRVI